MRDECISLPCLSAAAWRQARRAKNGIMGSAMDAERLALEIHVGTIQEFIPADQLHMLAPVSRGALRFHIGEESKRYVMVLVSLMQRIEAGSGVSPTDFTSLLGIAQIYILGTTCRALRTAFVATVSRSGCPVVREFRLPCGHTSSWGVTPTGGTWTCLQCHRTVHSLYDVIEVEDDEDPRTAMSASASASGMSRSAEPADAPAGRGNLIPRSLHREAVWEAFMDSAVLVKEADCWEIQAREALKRISDALEECDAARTAPAAAEAAAATAAADAADPAIAANGGLNALQVVTEEVSTATTSPLRWADARCRGYVHEKARGQVIAGVERPAADEDLETPSAELFVATGKSMLLTKWCQLCCTELNDVKLKDHEKASHDRDEFKCSCGNTFCCSQDLRRHSRSKGHAIAKTFLTKEELDAIVPR